MTEKKKYLIDLLLQITNQTDILEKKINNIFDMLNNAFPGSDAVKAKKIRNLFNKEEILHRLTPIIDLHFSVEELEQVVNFYSTPAGKKLIDPSYEKQCNAVMHSLIDEIELKITKNTAKGSANV